MFAVIIAGLEGQKNWLTLLFWMGHKSHLPGPGMGLFDRLAGTTGAAQAMQDQRTSLEIAQLIECT